MHPRHALAAAGLMFVGLLAVPVSSASATSTDVIYTSTDAGAAIATIDPATGMGSVLGSTGYRDGYAVAVDPDGTVWAVVNGYSASDQLARVDTATGQATPLSGSIGTPMITLEAAGDGTLYGVGMNDVLYRIDKTTGVGSAIGSGTGMGGQTMDLAFDCHGTLWATGMGDVYTVDTTTGMATMQASLSGFGGASMVMGLMYDSACHMLATTYSNPGSLYSIDPATGAGTPVGSTGLNSPHGGSIRAFVQDRTAPVTTDDVPTGWQAAPPAVTLTATDDASGVAHTHYTTGASPAAPTTSSRVYDAAHKPVLADGEKIRYFSIDADGNAEAPVTSTAAKVDTVAPVSTDDVPVAAAGAPVLVTLSATDGGSGVTHIFYELGSDPAAPTSRSAEYDPAHKPVVAAGQRLRYFAVDATGNAETPHTSAAVRGAVTAPRTSKRVITLRLRKHYAGRAVRSISARIAGGGTVKVRRDGNVKIDLRGRGCGVVKVKFTVKLRGAKPLTLTRKYRTCTPGA